MAIGELDLAAGDAEAAAEAAERVLRRLGPASPLERFPALELLARARARAGAGDDAAAGVAELRGGGRAARDGLHAGARRASCAAEVRLEAATTTARGGPPRTPSTASRRAPRRTRRRPRGSCWPARWRASGAPIGPRPRSERARETLAALGSRRDDAPASDELTARELDVLRLVAEGLSDAEIAGRLFLSPHTVHRHVANVRRKLGLPSRAAAVAHAAQAGLL